VSLRATLIAIAMLLRTFTVAVACMARDGVIEARKNHGSLARQNITPLDQWNEMLCMLISVR
jgi:hypothetical protein